MKPVAFLTAVVLILLGTASVSGQTKDVDFTVTVRNPVSHIYDVEMDIRGVRETSVDVAMPVWEPGVYAIKDFARNVQDLHASTLRNQPLQTRQVDKHTWHISKAATDDVAVHYQVFSLRLTDEIADVQGPALFMYLPAETAAAFSVKYNTPGGWKVLTPLEKRSDRYYAPDYDALVDAPAFAGEHFKVIEFEVDKVPHRLVFSRPGISMVDAQVTSDLTDIVKATRSVFGATLPYKDYMFLVRIQPMTGSTELAHAHSARLTAGENDFVNEGSYRRFLFAAARAYFQGVANKALRQAARIDYSKENPTRQLWFSEGVASYFADIILCRADIASADDYLFRLGTEIDVFEHAAGRLLMSAEDAGVSAWSRSDNADNNAISYELKGEIVGALLDADIRIVTGFKKSLDDVIAYLLTNSGPSGSVLADDGIEKAVDSVTGADFRDFFSIAVQGRGKLDYERFLKPFGLQISIARQPGTIYSGVEYETGDGGSLRVKRALPGSPAEKAHLDAGDILLALDGERLTADNFRSRLHSHKVGEVLKLTFLRGDRLLATELTPIEFQSESWNVVEAPQPTPDQNKFRAAWLGGPKP